MSYLDLLRLHLPEDEGTRRKPYTDIMGRMTVGVGRNLYDVGVRDDEIALMLENDIREAESAARYLLPDFDSLSDVRKYVVCNMAFNLGQSRLAGFEKFLLAVHEQRWVDAAIEMLDSTWASQVGDRAKRLAEAMRTDSV